MFRKNLFQKMVRSVTLCSIIQNILQVMLQANVLCYYALSFFSAKRLKRKQSIDTQHIAFFS